jgi:hypothetical protein
MKKFITIFFSVLASSFAISQNITCELPDSVAIKLKTILEKVNDDDQEIRSLLDNKNHDSLHGGSPWLLTDSVDRMNFNIISHILSKYGWLGNNCVGEKANNAIFLVLQHAFFLTIDERKKYLKMMKEAVKNGKLDKIYVAYFEDRTLRYEGKKQKYGTQLTFNRATGKSELDSVENEQGLNKRRKKMGLGTIEEYLKESFDIIYHPKK